MRAVLFTVLLILCFVGCSRSPSVLDSSNLAVLADDDVSSIVHGTMRQIHSDLIKLKEDFPQLKDIDSAKVTSNNFQYSKGWVSSSKTQGITFNKDGCTISFRTSYPAKSTDVGQLAGSPYMKLANRKYLKFWRLVMAENTKEADRFKGEANRIISENITRMLNQLGHMPKDYVLELPEEE